MDNIDFKAYHVIRSFENGMILSYSSMKTHLQEFEEIDQRIVDLMMSFVLDLEK